MEYPKRKNHRLLGYDYRRQGGYFLTVCTHERQCTLSRVHEGGENERATVELTEMGEILWRVLQDSAQKYGVIMDACVIMPNHIHMVIFLQQGSMVSAGRFVGIVKSITANLWRMRCDERGIRTGKLWQRDYYDHILRNDADYNEKLKYMDENPDKWMLDDLYRESQ